MAELDLTNAVSQLYQGAPSPESAGQAPQDFGVGDYTWDAAKGVVGGARDAIQETVDFGHTIVNGVDDILGTDVIDNDVPSWLTLPEVQTQTVAGDITRGLSQFLVGFVGAGKFLKVAKLGGMIAKAGKAAKYIEPAVQGAIADFTVFDPHEQRLSDLIEQHTPFGNAVTSYLQSDPNDSDMEGRLKQALEGMVVGGVTDAAMAGFRGLRKFYHLKATDPTAAKKALVESADEVDTLTKQLGEANSAQAAQLDDATQQAAERISIGSRVKATDSGAMGTVTELDKVNRTAKIEYLDAETNRVKYSEVPLHQLDGDAFRHINADANEQLIRASKDMPVEEAVDIISKKKSIDDINADDFTNKSFVQWGGAKDLAAYTDELMSATEGLRSAKPYDTSKFKARVTREMDQLGGDVARVFAGVEQDTKSLHTMAARYNIMSSVTEELSRRTLQLRDKVFTGAATEVDEAMFIHHAKLWAESANMLKDASKAWGSGFYHLRGATRKVPNLSLENISEIITKTGGRKQVKKLAQQMKAADNPKAMLNLLSGTKWGRRMDVANEWFINAILSGPKTHFVNTMSNAFKALLTPAEMYIGGAMEGGARGATARREAAQIFVGLKEYLWTATKLAGKSMRIDSPILDPIATTMDTGYVHAISSANRRLGQGLKSGLQGAGLRDFIDNTPKSGLDHLIDGIGTMVRLPTRFMMGMDEMAKQVNYRAHLHSKLYSAGLDKGITDPKKLAEFISDQMDRAFDSTGGALAKDSLQYSRRMTYTDTLDRGFGKSLQEMAGRSPWMRQIVPFIRTPTNIILDVWDHTPFIGKHMQRMKADLDFATHGDASRAAMARGKMAVGKLVWMSAATASMSGLLTGGGPRDTAKKAQMMETGWRPYSFKIGDKYIPYQRVEPFGTVLGLMADFFDVIGNHYDDDEAVTQFATAMVSSVAANITSKTYLKGMMDVTNVMHDPARYAESWIAQQAAARLPFSSALGQARQMVDPVIREARGVVDAMMNKTPGLSSDLPARRSWVSGEPLYYPGGSGWNPFAPSEAVNDPVRSELVNLDHGFSGPPRKVNGVDITTEQHSRYSELMGKVQMQGKTLHDYLGELYKSPEYKALPDSTSDMEGGKLRVTRKVIGAYQRAARAFLLREDQGLYQKVQQARVEQLQLLQRQTSAPSK
ncbi:hypothetical protein KKH36_04295 [Patescibacteria group bacterium]|nr:hypothetical protein [Patescibacteria group bacterium]